MNTTKAPFPLAVWIQYNSPRQSLLRAPPQAQNGKSRGTRQGNDEGAGRGGPVGGHPPLPWDDGRRVSWCGHKKIIHKDTQRASSPASPHYLTFWNVTGAAHASMQCR